MAYQNSLKNQTMCAKGDSTCNYVKTESERTINQLHFKEKIWSEVGKQNRFPPPFALHLLHCLKRTTGLPLKPEATNSNFCIRKEAGGLIHPASQNTCSELDNGRQSSQDRALAHCHHCLCLQRQSWEHPGVSLEIRTLFVLHNIQVYYLSWRAGHKLKSIPPSTAQEPKAEQHRETLLQSMLSDQPTTPFLFIIKVKQFEQH